MRLINPLILIGVLGIILAIEAVSFLACIPVAVYYGESLMPFIGSTIIAGIVALIFCIISRKTDISRASMRDGYLIVTLSWFTLSLAGSLPYLLSGTIHSFTDAFFESASGFTTTGSSIIDNVEALPFSILFWRSLTHWIGGIGIIALVVLILPSLRVTGYHLFSLESSHKEKIHPKTKAIGYRILIIYISLTVVEVILLMLGDMNLFDSICHAFGTVATGGFSTKNMSLAYFSSYTQYIVMIFMFLSGVSQVIYYYIFKFNFRKVKQNEEVWFYIAVVLIAGFIASFILHFKSNDVFEQSFREGFFQVVSIITCTGYASADYLIWPSAGVMIIFLLLFSGGSTGSTSGGIKMARHLIVLKNIKNAFVRLSHPNAVSVVKLNKNVVTEQTNRSILSFITLYIFVFMVGTVIVVAAGSDLITSSSAVASCMAGIGPGLGAVGPMSNYAAMPIISKIVLSLVMILGRLEIITAFALFTRSFWKN